jgi:hypothetical protein
LANAAADDEFLAGTSVSGDRAPWVAYLAWSTLITRQLPIISQAIYFPVGQPAVGATTKGDIDPTGWTTTQQRCPDTPGCSAAGDFATIASNPFAAVSTPFLTRTTKPNDLFQIFVVDAKASNVPNFKPNFVRFPVGANITSLGRPRSAPSRGFDPGKRHPEWP